MEATSRANAAAADVVVVGGGVIGLALAWRAAQGGMAVTVVDPRPGRGASWAAAGMLAPVTEVRYGEERLLELNLASSRLWPGFAAELADVTGHDVGYRRCGTLVVARDLDDNVALDDLYAFQRKLGLAVERLRGREARRLEPGLAPRTRGAILVTGDHQVDNRALVGALLAAARHARVRFVDRPASAVDVAGGRAIGVRLDDGQRLAAGTVVVAAGCQGATLAGLPPGTVPVRPVKGQLLHLRTPAGVPAPASRNVRGLDVYVVTRADGRVVVGATVEERGFDTTVTAGAARALLRDAWEILPGVDELELVDTVAGLRPGSPDNAPLLGRSAVDGVVLATGHFRNGILLTPLTAWAIAELLSTGRTPPRIAPFEATRFAGAGQR